ncbi:hypothetical protein BU17DRAFT_55464 [Hysterangium stoloniferum]|nr:hypothetical protein BU17DRAFT_55464 [Hysterangium stoloniferum]
MAVPVSHPGVPIVDPLDPTFYKMKTEVAAFMKDQTGINDDEELKTHILTVQAEAYAIYPYPCIRRMSFLTFKLAGYPAYETVLKIGKERPNAVFLDLGCCFGNDARKAVADGYPIQNVLLSDLQPRFHDLGHKLFKTDQNSYPIHFLQGDIFNPDFLSPESGGISTQIGQPPSLDTLTSLIPLQHHISVIHISSVFHLFDESQQCKLARLLGVLLSPLPGSIILGSQIGVPDQEDENWTKAGGNFLKLPSDFVNSPASWEAMWVGGDGIFKPEEVVLDTRVNLVFLVGEENSPQDRQNGSNTACLMTWSITRT